MATINLSVSEMLTTTYSAVTLLGDEPDGFSDTMTTLTSTATTAGSLVNNTVNITLAQNYIESMSDEQLQQLRSMIIVTKRNRSREIEGKSYIKK